MSNQKATVERVLKLCKKRLTFNQVRDLLSSCGVRLLVLNTYREDTGLFCKTMYINCTDGNVWIEKVNNEQYNIGHELRK